MHSKSVLVSVIFEKDDEAGRRGLFERQTVFKSLYPREGSDVIQRIETGCCEFRRRPVIEHHLSENITDT